MSQTVFARSIDTDQVTALGRYPAQLSGHAPDWLEDDSDGREGGGKMRLRTIWISDVHLGTRGCNADLLMDFLKSTESQTLYLVGDIIDGWRLRKRWFWTQRHNDVVRKLLKKAKRGTHVVFIPGNHDEAFRPYVGLNLGGIDVASEAIHKTADGRRLLVLHGDEFDGIVLYARWLAFLGDTAYVLLLRLNVAVNMVRRWLGLPFWSLSAYLKRRVKNAVEYVCRYEQAIAREARQRGVDGVVCGHIHAAEIRTIDGVLYCNDGDWVESCTALVEHMDGRLELLHWADHVRARTASKEARALAEPVPA